MNHFYGLLGEKLTHSLSPQIHSFIFRHLGIDAGYFLFPVKPQELSTALTGLKLLGSGGVNVTIPYKVAIMEMLDELSPEAKSIGAVNTITFENHHTKGYNTDYQGFGLLLKNSDIDINGKTAIILGTGGAAKTVACYLRNQGIKDLHMVARNPSSNSPEFPLLSYNELDSVAGADLIINCTPLGMFPAIQHTPVDKHTLKKFSVAIDLIYNPYETCFLRVARDNGLKTCNGLTMLIGQAAAAQELWQKREIDMTALQPLSQILADNLHT